ncbi:MAG: hypothetical protein KGZ33_02010 [Alkaliphilus sp.]|nr:hypothetical protein [Alkaliphilus sp.]
MIKTNHNEEVMNNLIPCGVITCIHYVSGYCNKCDECDLYERSLIQEN